MAGSEPRISNVESFLHSGHPPLGVVVVRNSSEMLARVGPAPGRCRRSTGLWPSRLEVGLDRQAGGNAGLLNLAASPFTLFDQDGLVVDDEFDLVFPKFPFLMSYKKLI